MIRAMIPSDREEIIEMMRVFYSSDAVNSNGSEEIFQNDFENCVGECPFLEGFTFIDGEKTAGYAMAAHSFSTEFGKPCAWIEDIYIKPEHRGKGLAKEFFALADERFKGCVIRLEVEENNKNAVRLYRKCGFDVLPYMEMKKNNGIDSSEKI